MKKKVDIKFDKSVGRIYQILCAVCKTTTNHIVIKSVSVDGSAPMTNDPDELFQWTDTFQIIKCQGCEDICFRKDHSDSEEYEYDESNEMIFPKWTTDNWKVKEFSNLPNNLERIYRETIDCFNSSNNTLCGAGVRALVESLCFENGIKSGEIDVTKSDGSIKKKIDKNLQGKINGLFEQGILTKQNAATLHEHRLLGNRAVHQLSAPTKKELTLAIGILEKVFDSLYEVPHTAMKLRHTRINKSL